MFYVKRCTAATIGLLFYAATIGGALAADTIRINGSGTVLDMLKPMLEAYRKNNNNIAFEMEKPLGSSGAVKALISGALDIAASSKPLTAEESSKGCQLKTFGKTPLVIVTQQKVKKTDISSKELEDIYNGTTTFWPDGEKIRIVLRPQGDIDTIVLRRLSPGMNAAITNSQSRPGMIVAVTDPEGYSLISKTPGAVGVTGLPSIILEKLPLNILSLNNVKPSTKSLANGTYPLAKNIDFVITAKTSPAALKFLDFAYSKQGRMIAEKAGVLVTTATH